MSGFITKLEPNEVFVFGSNRDGFHGAGAAGYAMRGTSSNTWRTDEAFLKAMRAPIGHPDRVGKWAVYGVGRGFQRGREGMSYAIQTIERAGWKRSTPLDEIQGQIVELCSFCRAHPEWTFLFTPIGAGLSGWTEDEMRVTLGEALVKAGGCPPNLIIPPDIYGERTDWRVT
jgi:hypothetical protein